MKMEYQKIINLLDNTPNQPTKLRTKNWVEINDESHRVYNTGSQIKFKTSTMRSSLWDCSDAYILVSRTITAAEIVAGGENNNAGYDKKIFPFFSRTQSKFLAYIQRIREVNQVHANGL